MALGKHRVDTVLVISIVSAVIFGIIMIYSASAVVGFTTFGDDKYFFKRQIVSAILGFIAMAVTANLDYRRWKEWATWLLGATVVLLLAVFLFSKGSVNGAHRWISLAGQSFQPSELAKFTLIVYISAWLCKQEGKIKSIMQTFVPFVVILAVISGLMLAEPDFGTLTIMLAAAIAVYIVAGMSWQQASIGGGVAALAGSAILAVPYRRARIETFLNPPNDPTNPAFWHIHNILIAIGSGGWFGLGFGASKQKQLFLPEPHTDSIFAVITEELGFIIATLLIGLFVVIIYRGYRVAAKAQDTFGRYLATGITTWIAFQMFINLASMLKMVPLVGVPLPFISFGGTSLIITLAAVGVLLNVSRHIEGKEQAEIALPRRRKVGRVA